MPSLESLSDPYDDLSADYEVESSVIEPRAVQAALSTLWAMLSRRSDDGASTLAAHRVRAAEQLWRALRPWPAQADLAAALTDMLTLGAQDPARFCPAARAASLEAVERLLLAQASEPGASTELARPRPRPLADHALAPVVVAALPSAAACARVERILGHARVDVHVVQTVEALETVLAETAADLVLLEVGLPSTEPGAPPSATALCDVVRAQPLHLRTPVLCLDNTPGARVTGPLSLLGARPGIRVGPRPISRAEFLLRVRALLPLD